MKKHLSIIFTTVATSALAQTSNVSLYGTMDLGVRRASGLDLSNAPIPGSITGLVSGIDNTSRWGMRGVEDLGGGLKASFNLETGIAADTGQPINAAKYFDRASWVGLGSDWGRVTAGRQTSLLADTVALTDPLGVRFASFNPAVAITGLSAHGLGIEYGPAGSSAGSYRLDNSLKYVGNVGGFTGSLMYAFGEANNSTRSRYSKGAALQYARDALTVSGAIQTFQANDTRKLEGWALGATYRIGAFRLAGLLGDNRANTSPIAETRQRSVSLGLTWSASPAIDVTTAYSRLGRSRTGRSDDGYGRLITFVEYKLSRRSKVYGEFDITRWRNGYQGVGADSQAHGVSVGMSHSF
ncbi:MAG: porin [Hyphomicrobiales bacterium]|nr:MAG: porin [Hyphomicrobiales bacterium]